MPDYAVSTSFTAVDRTTGTMKNMTTSITKYGAEAERSFDKAARASARAAASQERLHKMGQGIKSGAVAGGALVAGGIAAGGMAAFSGLEKIISAGDQMNDVAQAIGLTTAALQEYHYVAELSGVETEAMDKALTKLTVGLGKGDQAVIDALSAIGVGFDQVRNAKPDEVLEAVAQGFQNTKDNTLKAAAATALFGKSNVKMVNALSGGAEGLKELRDEAHKTGYVMSDELIAASAKNDDQMHRMQANLKGVANQLGAHLIPVLTKGADAISEFVQNNKEAIGVGIDKFFERMSILGQKLAPVFKKLGPVFEKIGEVFDSLMPIIGAAADLLAELIPVLNPVLDIVKQLAATIGRVLVQAFTFLKPIIATVIRIFEQVGPIIGRIIDKFGQFIGQLMKSLTPVLEKLLPIIEKVFVVAFKIAEPILNAIFDVLGGIVMVIGNVADAFMSVLGPAINWILDALAPVGKFIQGIIDGIKDALVFIGVLDKKDVTMERVNRTISETNAWVAGNATKANAPNQQAADARQSSINFTGNLNIAGAPAGSSVQTSTTGAKPVNVNMMGAPAR